MRAMILRVSEDEVKKYREDSSLLESRFFNGNNIDDTQLLDIDKSWDGIIFLLTGAGIQESSGELMQLLFSGQFIDDSQDFGFGPPHYLPYDELKPLYHQMEAISDADLEARFNPEKMISDDIYPAIWDAKDSYEYLFEYYNELKAFLKTALANRQAIISVVS